jgi:hypothetical protein
MRTFEKACVGLVLVFATAAACGGGPEVEVLLDLETLQAEAPEGTYRAEAVPNAYVGAVDDDLFVALAFPEGGTADPDPVAVYLCDGRDVSIWLAGELEGESGSLSNDDVEIAFERSGDDWIGTITFTGAMARAFTVSAAAGVAGLYRAEETFDEVRWIGAWIVLADGQQRGFRWGAEEEEELQM